MICRCRWPNKLGRVQFLKQPFISHNWFLPFCLLRSLSVSVRTIVCHCQYGWKSDIWVSLFQPNYWLHSWSPPLSAHSSAKSIQTMHSFLLFFSWRCILIYVDSVITQLCFNEDLGFDLIPVTQLTVPRHHAKFFKHTFANVDPLSCLNMLDHLCHFLSFTNVVYSPPLQIAKGLCAVLISLDYCKIVHFVFYYILFYYFTHICKSTNEVMQSNFSIASWA